MIAEWNEIGIPEGYGPRRLLYNPASETLIAELQSVGEEFMPNKIYVRHKDEHAYEPLVPLLPAVSSESAVTSFARPLLFYISRRIVKRERDYAGQWEGLYSFDISGSTCTRLPDLDPLSLPRPYPEAWINDLVGVSPDAAELYFRVSAVSPGSTSVDHHLARMDLRSGKVDFIAALKGAFF